MCFHSDSLTHLKEYLKKIDLYVFDILIVLWGGGWVGAGLVLSGFDISAGQIPAELTNINKHSADNPPQILN